MRLHEAAQQCRGYLHKYPTSGADVTASDSHIEDSMQDVMS